jgi:D-glycerate 3-kinase
MTGDRFDFWRSLADWIAERVAESDRRPLLVGLSAPQGAGKTTLTREVGRMLEERGIRAVSLSIDDFYLTRPEQVAVAAEGNPYLRVRGLPGTHDIALGTRTLRALKLLGAGERMKIPAYDRSAFSGKGDRRPQADWPEIVGPLDVAILEGWMLGFTPVDPATIGDADFRAVNETLAAYDAWHAELDAFIWLEPEDFTFVRTWRAEAEEKMRAEGKPGMTPEEVADFVKPYLACYPVYYPGLRQGSPVGGPYLQVRIGRNRLPS